MGSFPFLLPFPSSSHSLPPPIPSLLTFPPSSLSLTPPIPSLLPFHLLPSFPSSFFQPPNSVSKDLKTTSETMLLTFAQPYTGEQIEMSSFYYPTTLPPSSEAC